MGEYEESPRGTEDRPEVIGHRHGVNKRRPYAVANVSQGTVTLLCALNSFDAILAVRVEEDDVIWWTTRVNVDKSHLHDDKGNCIRKVFHAAKAGIRLAR